MFMHKRNYIYIRFFQGVAARLLPLVFLGILSCQSDSPKEPIHPTSPKKELKINDCKLKGLRGKVAKVIEKSYQSPAEVLADDPYSIAQTSFRPDGNIKEMLIEMRNSERNTFTYAYFEDSIIVRSLKTIGDSILDRQFFVYLQSPDGVRYKMFSFNANRQLLLSSTILSNDAGLPIENQNIVANKENLNKIPCKEQFGYDEQGFLTAETWFRYNTKTGNCEPSNTLRSYKNDAMGNCIKELIVKDETMILGKYSYQYKYDDKGNWTEKTSYLDTKEGQKIKSVMLREFYFFDN